MKFGLPISLGLHGAIIGASLFGIYSPKHSLDDMQIIPVKIYAVSDVTNIRAAIKAPEPMLKPEPETLEPSPATTAPKPDVTPEPVLTAEPKPDEAKPDAPDDTKTVAESVAKPETKPAPSEPAKPKPLSIDDLSALLAQSKDKITESGDSAPQQMLEGERNRIEQAALARQAQGLGTGLTSSYEDAIMRRVYNSWHIPSGAPDLESLIVTVTVSLDRNGVVTSAGLSADSAANARSNDYYRTAAESALRAVQDAKQFKFLPRSEYERWKTLTLTFHPKDASTGIKT
jgi:outer membrane biosynthesis protein TonB